jgi:hypothetical protein
MIAISIDDKAGDAVGLRPYDAAKGFIEVGCFDAEIERLADAADEKVGIEVLAST